MNRRPQNLFIDKATIKENENNRSDTNSNPQNKSPLKIGVSFRDSTHTLRKVTIKEDALPSELKQKKKKH